MGYSFRLTARVLLYAPSHRQDSTYHGLCYTSRGALAGTRNKKEKECAIYCHYGYIELEVKKESCVCVCGGGGGGGIHKANLKK